MKRGIFITYNSVGRGWADGAFGGLDYTSCLYQGRLRKAKSSLDLKEKRRVFERLWREMLADLNREGVNPRTIDEVVVYCGKLPNVAINLAAKTFAPSQVIFVHCGCGPSVRKNKNMLRARYIYSECGGIDTMRKIWDRFLKTGEVTAYMDVEQASRPKGL